MSLNSQRDTILLNGQLYRFTVQLLNGHMPQGLTIPVGIIETLIIDDSLYSIFPSGKCVIDSTGNKIDQYISEQTNELRERLNRQAYAFNTDSRDHLLIHIKPITEDGDDDRVFPPDIFKLEYMFAIYDEEEVIRDPDSNYKQKIFYLRDHRAQVLLETKLQWSTTHSVLATHEDKINVAQVGNRLRKQKTGIAILDFILTALPDTSFENKFAKDWDPGETSTFYTSSPQSNAYDDLEALLDQHIGAGTKDNCVLGVDRDDKWFLRSYAKIFDSALSRNQKTVGPGVTKGGDVFALHDNQSSPLHPNANEIPVTSMFNFGMTNEEMEQFDGLAGYNFMNMSNTDSLNEIVTTFVHNYNKGNKQFNIDGVDSYILNIKQRLKELYADSMLGTLASPIIPINNQKISNIIANHVYSHGATKTDRLKAGVNRVMNKCLAYAPGLNFYTEGHTHRTSGKFSIITRGNSEPQIPFSKVLLGEWLMTGVQHHFLISGNQYWNNITCIKAHSYAPLTQDIKDEKRDALLKEHKKRSKADTPKQEKEQEKKAKKPKIVKNVNASGAATINVNSDVMKKMTKSDRKDWARSKAEARAIRAALGDQGKNFTWGDSKATNEKWDPKTGKYSADFTFDKVQIDK